MADETIASKVLNSTNLVCGWQQNSIAKILIYITRLKIAHMIKYSLIFRYGNFFPGLEVD